MDTAAIIREILEGYALHPRGFHGVVHWARVMENGLKLAAANGADPTVVTLFALFHDSRRESDGPDWGHGLRGARLAKQLRGTVFDLNDADFELLYRACEHHTEGRSDESVTVCTCWDADRLDLGRVGITPDPKYLCTKEARRPEMIAWADKRAKTDFGPTIVQARWGIPLEVE
ncbi:HD domain-containing protein [Limnoglobus roseus]|uniref:HD domain-containing protein n=1 Tax=Limnoglobus roseus TaxID=2598579 RepID=A0A5C1A9N8_9BACT|nr:hypothetical protein [Limnoglobus roseus]QEL15275.1 hypothetical protein PX52LOC_02190 [Limnoglobus roseus]